MLITKEYLKSLSPCENRYEHYLTHYKDWRGTLEEFLDLAELTHDDKKWVFVRSISKDKLRLVAADFAERVLHLFESKYPTDDRPRKAIEAARNGDAAAAARAAARAAAYAANAAADAARKNEEKAQIEIMKKYAREALKGME